MSKLPKKTCDKCSIEKFALLFPSDRSICKLCKKKYNKTYHATPEAKATKQARQSTPEYKDWQREYNKSEAGKEAQASYRATDKCRASAIVKAAKHAAKHPEKVAARKTVRNAVKSGRLIKQPCTICNTTANVEGHHPDYSKPLYVIWLCKEHHDEEHRKLT